MTSENTNPWDAIELSDGPAKELTLRDWVFLCEGDLCKARLMVNFRSDVIETLEQANEVFPPDEGFKYLVEYLAEQHKGDPVKFMAAVLEELAT